MPVRICGREYPFNIGEYGQKMDLFQADWQIFLWDTIVCGSKVWLVWDRYVISGSEMLINQCIC